MSTKIHHRVAEVLGMAIDEEEDTFYTDTDTELMEVESIPVPTGEEVSPVDNAELPVLHNELVRIEHGQRQTELLLEKGLTAVQNALAELPMITPQYKPRAVEAAAELFKAVADLSKFKIEVQIKLTELRMKEAAFQRSKGPANPLGTVGNTFINREELMRGIHMMTSQESEDDEEPEDDDEDK